MGTISNDLQATLTSHIQSCSTTMQGQSHLQPWIRAEHTLHSVSIPRLLSCASCRGDNLVRSAVHKENKDCADVSVSASRRQAVLVALLTSPAAMAATAADTQQSQPATAAMPAQRDPSFYATWPYATPSDILPYIQHECQPGDAQAVLDAMDSFSDYYP